MIEADILARVRLALQKLKTTTFRNNVGLAWMGQSVQLADGTVVIKSPRRVRFGLLEGSSDIIGFTEHIVTESDIGRRVAVFTAIETKAPRGRPTDAQELFISKVKLAGGIAGIAKNEQQAEDIVNRWRRRE